MTVHLTEILHAIQTQQVRQPDLFLLLTFQITYLWKLHLSLSKLTTIMETKSCLNPLVTTKGCFHPAAPDYQDKTKSQPNLQLQIVVNCYWFQHLDLKTEKCFQRNNEEQNRYWEYILTVTNFSAIDWSLAKFSQTLSNFYNILAADEE